MKTYLVVTITCPDRPGIVERITEIAVQFSANWEDSRMARLGGDFAGIVRICVAVEKAEALTKALLELADDETTVVVKATRAGPPKSGESHVLCDLKLTGADHEGIVHKVSAFLAGRGINVESMETTVSPAPMSASPLFHMEAVIKVPPNMTVDDLDASLQQIGDELGVDVGVSRCQT